MRIYIPIINKPMLSGKSENLIMINLKLIPLHRFGQEQIGLNVRHMTYWAFVFTGHPNLHRIMLGENWVGHPLRKDYVDDNELEV